MAHQNDSLTVIKAADDHTLVLTKNVHISEQDLTRATHKVVKDSGDDVLWVNTLVDGGLAFGQYDVDGLGSIAVLPIADAHSLPGTGPRTYIGFRVKPMVWPGRMYLPTVASRADYRQRLTEFADAILDNLTSQDA